MAKVKQKNNIGFIIALSIVSSLLLLFIILFSLQAVRSTEYANSLENIYQKNMYELSDNINNTEIKLSKVLSSTDNNYQAKLLREISYNTDMAQNNLNNLPYSINGLNESIAFVNQVSGYTETLSKNIEAGNKLSSKELSTLEGIYDTVLTMKDSLAKFSESMWNDYNILTASKSGNEDSNNFTRQIGLIKEGDIEYPTMIYDGPFSDSVVNKKISGLSNTFVSKEDAKKNLLNCFTIFNKDQIEYKGETNGKFETFDFIAKNESGQQIMYIQMTKKGGNLLTASSSSDEKEEIISIDSAKETALNFVSKSAVDSAEVVWSANVGGNAYINIAPVVNDIVYYPDLIKLKIDLSNGNILGYEASAYYTNHHTRTLPSVKISSQTAKSKIEKKYTINFKRVALIPLDYNQEILCHEFCCSYSNDTYYFYYDVETGELVNVLKVIKTNNGTLLM